MMQEQLDSNTVIHKNVELELNTSLKNFQELFSDLNENLTNIVPFEGSWTAGQLARHVIKVNSGFLKQLTGPVKDTNRKYDELAEGIRISLSVHKIRMKSPEYVQPELIDYTKKELLDSIKEINDALIQSVKSVDMTKTCLLFEVPFLGYLTRLEAVYFVTYHTQRHINQMKNIIESLGENKKRKEYRHAKDNPTSVV